MSRIQKYYVSFLLLYGCSVPMHAQLIKHSYRFFNNLSVSAPECGPDLVPIKAPGNCTPPAATGGDFITDNLQYCGLSRLLYHNNLHWGLQYNNSMGTVTNTYTIHIYLKNTNWGNSTWARIIDFSNGSSDQGIYFKKNTPSPNRCLDFYPSGVVGACPFFNDSTYYLLTFTRNGATNIIDVYVNNTLFTSFSDAGGKYAGVAGTPINVYCDDQPVPCESGSANFAYLSFTNQYSNQATVNAVYNDICTIANFNSDDFSFSPPQSCHFPENVQVQYTGTIAPPGTGFTFSWNWDGGTVVSGTGMGPYIISWPTTGIKHIQMTITNSNCATQNSISKTIALDSSKTTRLYQSVCEGQNYLGYTITGVYTDSFLSVTGCDSIRILNLTVKPRVPVTNITNSICAGQSFSGYNVSGTYTDTFTAVNGCDSIRKLVLTVRPVNSTTLNHTICAGQNYFGYTYAGIYNDTFTAANGCDSIRILQLTVLPVTKPNLGADRDFCKDDTLLLQPGSFTSYLWQDGSTQPVFIARLPGQYDVQVIGNCGLQADTVLLTEKPCNIEFPNVFTPNADGKNETFGMLNAINLQSYIIKVFNRWGQIVFQSANPLITWDGKLNGNRQPDGLYIWTCNFIKNNKQFYRKGTVLLLR